MILYDTKVNESLRCFTMLYDTKVNESFRCFTMLYDTVGYNLIQYSFICTALQNLQSEYNIYSPQAFFSSITDMCENGGKRPVTELSVGFTKEQADTIRRIRNSKDSWDMLGVKPGATR